MSDGALCQAEACELSNMVAAAACTASCCLHRCSSKSLDAAAELPAADVSCPCCCAVELDRRQPFRHCPADYVSCPSCGRTLFDLQEVTESIRQRTGHLPGEMCRPARLPSAVVFDHNLLLVYHTIRNGGPMSAPILCGCCMLCLQSTA